MADKEKCENPAKHKVHMCKLRKDGKIEEIEKFEANPIVYCNKCRIKANDPCVVCNPRALKPGK